MGRLVRITIAGSWGLSTVSTILWLPRISGDLHSSTDHRVTYSVVNAARVYLEGYLLGGWI
jgi:hypothetical protein